MSIFVANIRLDDNKIVQEEVEFDNLDVAVNYFNNYLEYWSKVWFGWKDAYIIDIEEKIS